MAWGFLGALGGALAKGAQAGWQGLQQVGQGIGTGAREVVKVPERIAGKFARPEALARTPNLNPAAGGLGRSVDMLDRVRAPIANPTGGLPLPAMDRFSVDLPQPMGKPPLTGLNWHTPGDAGTNLPANIALPSAPGALGTTPGKTPLPSRPPLQREGVPIPQLPGRPGGPQAYDPETSARYDYVMKGADWQDTNGDGTPDKPHFKRNWKDMLKNAGLGFLQGMGQTGSISGGLGGAVAGGAGTAISPQAGREYTFDMAYAPQMASQRERQMEREAQDLAMERGRMQNEDVRGRIEDRKTDNERLVEDQTLRREEAARRAQEFDVRMKEAEQMRQLREAQARYRIVSPEATIYDQETGEPIYTAPPRERRPESIKEPKVAEPGAGNLSRIDKLYDEANSLWAMWKQAQQGQLKDKDGNPIPADEIRLQAEAALKAYNEATGQMGRDYPDAYETGQGEGGWAYRKRRQGPQRPGGESTRSAADLTPLLGGQGYRNASQLPKLR